MSNIKTTNKGGSYERAEQKKRSGKTASLGQASLKDDEVGARTLGGDFVFFKILRAGMEEEKIAAKEVLANKYEKMVIGSAYRKLVHTRNHSVFCMEDLVQEGYVGLLDALDKFNYGRGILFSTYMEYRINGAISDHIRSCSFLPRPVLEQISAVSDAAQKLRAKNIGTTPENIGKWLDWPIEKVEQALIAKNTNFVSLYEPAATDDESSALINIISDDRTSHSPIEKIAKDEIKIVLSNILSDFLSEKERRAVELAFGLNGQSYTIKEIGDFFNVSASRASQIINEALGKLRASKRVRESLKDFLT